MKRYIIIAAAVIAVIVIAAGVYLAPLKFNKNEKETIVYIYPGMGNEAINDSLKAQLGEDFGANTIKALKLLKADLSSRVGAYKIAEGASPIDAARILRHGGQTGIRVTFNNVRTKEQFAERVSQRLLMNKEDLLALLNDAEFCKQYGKTPETIVSLFFPDSYEFFWTVKAEDFVKKMHDNYTRFWNDERTAKAKALKLSPDEVTTIASIVEEEIAKREEAGIVGRLYINRLRKGIPLQACPTVKFAIGDFSLRRIYGSMLKTQSPYNTYINKGLPPGPIRFAEKRTIDAVLNAPEHSYLYMCAKDDFSGYHYFTANYAEHSANAKRYQRALNQRGITKK